MFRVYAIGILGAFLVSHFAGSLMAIDTRKPWNILFLAVDDLRPELGCYGIEAIRSPHIDRLASRSLVFDRAYCQVAVCNPSRSSLLSGWRPETTQILDNQHFLRPLHPQVVTLPQAFKNHGYGRFR